MFMYNETNVPILVKAKDRYQLAPHNKQWTHSEGVAAVSCLPVVASHHLQLLPEGDGGCWGSLEHFSDISARKIFSAEYI